MLGGMTSSGLTLDNFDRDVRPQDDLFGFVKIGRAHV